MSANANETVRKTKVFIVSEFVDGSRNSTGYYWHKIVTGLAKVRPGINVVSTQVSCELVDKSGHSAVYISVGEGKSYKKNRLFSRVIGQIAMSFLFIKSIVGRVKKEDIVFSGTNPAFMLLFISLLRPLIGFKWTLLVHDIFPENLVPAKIISKKSPFYPCLKYVFDRAYSRADLLIAIGRDMRELLIKKTGNASKIEYIPNWVDIEDIHLESAPSHHYFLTKKADRIVFQFFGNIGRVQGIDVILNAIPKVKNKKAAFLFIGNGAEESKVKKFVSLNPELDVTHVPNLPFDRNNDGLLTCDIAIVPLAVGMLGLGVPSKAYFSLAADKPILVVSDEESELQMLLNENPGVGWFCRAGDPDMLALVIDKICSDDLLALTGKPRALIGEKYDYLSAIEKYAVILKKLEENTQISTHDSEDDSK